MSVGGGGVGVIKGLGVSAAATNIQTPTEASSLSFPSVSLHFLSPFSLSIHLSLSQLSLPSLSLCTSLSPLYLPFSLSLSLSLSPLYLSLFLFISLFPLCISPFSLSLS